MKIDCYNLQIFLTGIQKILSSHALGFIATSFLLTLFGYCLVSIETGSRFKHQAKWIALVHLAPLLLFPIVVANEIINFSSLNITFGPKVKQSKHLLYLFGYIFHAYLSYQVLRLFLGLEDKLNVYQVYAKSFKNLGKNRNFILFFMLVSPLLTTSFLINFFLQCAMVSAPVLMPSIETLASYSNKFFKLDSNTKIGVLSLALVFFVFILIVVPFGLTKLLEKLTTIMGFYAFKMEWVLPSTGKKASRAKSNIAACFEFSLICVSSILHIVVSAITIIGIICSGIFSIDSVTESADAILLPVKTLMSPSIIVLVFLIISFSLVATMPYLHSILLVQLKKIRFFILLPPSVLALFGYLFPTGLDSRVHFLGGWLILTCYCVFLMSFFSASLELNRELATSKNMFTSKMNRIKRIKYCISTNLRSCSMIFLMTAYFMWMEDAIQLNLLQNNNGAYEMVHGMIISGIAPENYLALTVSFLCWLVVFFLVSRIRYI